MEGLNETEESFNGQDSLASLDESRPRDGFLAVYERRAKVARQTDRRVRLRGSRCDTSDASQHADGFSREAHGLSGIVANRTRNAGEQLVERRERRSIGEDDEMFAPSGTRDLRGQPLVPLRTRQTM